MRIAFTPSGWDDYTYWQTTDKRILTKINQLIDATCRDPYRGIGKPEQLRHMLAGTWSRRIDQEHRLVYLVEDDAIVILQSRYHYK